jgi:hypothetical protein
MGDRIAGIPADLADRPIGELSAVELMSALRGAQLEPGALAILPDKKKFELWVDEDGINKLNLGDLLDKLRGEKKKVELEKLQIEIPHKLAREAVIDPADVLRDPVFIDQIAEQVARRLGR